MKDTMLLLYCTNPQKSNKPELKDRNVFVYIMLCANNQALGLNTIINKLTNPTELCQTLGFINFLQDIEFAMHPAYFCKLDPNFLLAIMSNYFLLTDDEITSY